MSDTPSDSLGWPPTPPRSNKAPVPAPDSLVPVPLPFDNANLPIPFRVPFVASSIEQYLMRFREAVIKELDRRLVKNRPITELLLEAPNGRIYAVRVDNSGNLTTTLKYDPT